MTETRRNMLIDTLGEIRQLGLEKNYWEQARRCGWRTDDFLDPTLQTYWVAAGLPEPKVWGFGVDQ